MTLRGVASMVGKGDCYKANFELFVELVNAGEEAYLCHGIVTAASYYKHMKPGTKFMHAWVEANHPEHGWKVGDASLGELTFHPRKMWRKCTCGAEIYPATMEELRMYQQLQCLRNSNGLHNFKIWERGE